MFSDFKISDNGSIRFTSSSTFLVPLSWVYARMIVFGHIYQNNTANFMISLLDPTTWDDGDDEIVLCPIALSSAPKGVGFFLMDPWNRFSYEWHYLIKYFSFVFGDFFCMIVRWNIHYYYIINQKRFVINKPNTYMYEYIKQYLVFTFNQYHVTYNIHYFIFTSTEYFVLFF